MLSVPGPREISHERGHPRRAATPVDCAVHGDGSGSDLILDSQQVPHLERRPGQVLHHHVDSHQVVEPQGPAVPHIELEDGEVDPIVARPDLLIREAALPQHGRPGLLEVCREVAVVDDTHGIGFCESGPHIVDVPVVRPIERRLEGKAHGAEATARWSLDQAGSTRSTRSPSGRRTP